MRMIILVAVLASVVETSASDRTISDLQAGESVHIHFKSQGCFHSNEAMISITKTDDFEVEVLRVTGTGRVQVGLAAEEIAQLDVLLSYYRGLEEAGSCTSEDSVAFRWRGPAAEAHIEPFTDATCDAPVPGHRLIHRLATLVSDPRG